MSAKTPTDECRNRLDELAVELQAGEQEAEDLAYALEDIYADLKGFEEEAMQLEEEEEKDVVVALEEAAPLQQEQEDAEKGTPFVMVETQKDPSKC